MSDNLPERPSGRVLLIDDERRLLLFSARESLTNRDARTIWFLPGGGSEPGERFAECAARELFEETGLRVEPDDLAGPVGVRQLTFWFDGREIWANEAYFYYPIPSWEVDTSGFTELERNVVLAHRWWTLPELQTTNETVFPRASELADLLRHIFSTGVPPEPVRFSP
jgi:8-oxo-dGTP pyrophosphatase MutT (NUDIX family)